MGEVSDLLDWNSSRAHLLGVCFMLRNSSNQEILLTPAEVAALFRVDPKTVTRWAKAGKLTAIRTLGGHRRYRQSEVLNLLKANPDAGGLR